MACQREHTTMQFAVNYSPEAEDLVRGTRQDRGLQVPARLGLMATVQQMYPVYVHCAPEAGRGTGDAMAGDACHRGLSVLGEECREGSNRRKEVHFSRDGWLTGG
jgi:hypothetical protein